MVETLVKERFITYKEFQDDDIVLSLRELTEQKHAVKNELTLLEQELTQIEKKHTAQMKHINRKRDYIIAHTDFKPLKITNDKGRTGYANTKLEGELNQLDVLQKQVDDKRSEVVDKRDEFDEVKDTRNDYKTMIRLEISRREMVE